MNISTKLQLKELSEYHLKFVEEYQGLTKKYPILDIESPLEQLNNEQKEK